MSDSIEKYNIDLLGFEELDDASAAELLAKSFQIPIDRARSLVERAPVRVKSNVPKTDAQKYVGALLRIGADVKVAIGDHERIYRVADIRAGRDPNESQEGPPSSWRERTASHNLPAVGSGWITCPKCDTKQPKSEACVNCGVVYAKYEKRLEETASGLHRAVPGKRGKEEKEALGKRVPTGLREFRPLSSESAGFLAVSGDWETATNQAPSGTYPTAGVDSGRVPAVDVDNSHPDPYRLGPEDDDGDFIQAGEAFRPLEQILRSESSRGAAGAVAAARSLAPPPDHRARTASSVETTVESKTPSGMAIMKPTGVAAEAIRGSTDVGFWDKIGAGFLYCFKGSSWQWLAMGALLGTATGGALFVLLPLPTLFTKILGGALAYMLFSAFLSLQWRFFHNAFADSVSGKETEPGPLTDLVDFKTEYVVPGYVLSLGAIILWTPFLYVGFKAWSSGPVAAMQLSEVKLVLFALFPLVYWPMGMAFVSSYGRLTEILIVTGVVRSMVVGGLEYFFVTLIGVVLFAGSLFLLYPGTHIVVLIGAFYLIFTYVSGVQGFLIGKLLRRRPKMIKVATVEVTG
jgi:hypothetical protein